MRLATLLSIIVGVAIATPTPAVSNDPPTRVEMAPREEISIHVISGNCCKNGVPTTFYCSYSEPATSCNMCPADQVRCSSSPCITTLLIVYFSNLLNFHSLHASQLSFFPTVLSRQLGRRIGSQRAKENHRTLKQYGRTSISLDKRKIRVQN